MKSRAFALMALVAALTPIVAIAQVGGSPTAYAAGTGITISTDNLISTVPQSAFSNVSCTDCSMATLTMTSPVTLDGNPVATSASVADAIAAIAFPVTSVNGSTGAVTGLETSTHAAATYATVAQATYTGTGCISVSGARVISSTCSQPLTGTTGSIGGGLLSGGSCTSGTATVTGATVGMAAVSSPTTYPGDGAQWQTYVSSANTVTVKVCGLILITPVSTSYNVRVLQ